MRKTIFGLCMAFAVLAVVSTEAQVMFTQVQGSDVDKDKLRLTGRVAAEITQEPLGNGRVLFYDAAGNLTDSIPLKDPLTWRPGVFQIDIPRRDTTLIFDVECQGYQTKTVTFAVEKIHRRERVREIPAIYLERAARLGEVTVTSTKLKFYNRGDTIVYNADAFQTADGSMLDAIISQLPGTKIDSDGRITVNGEFVESLLLNGKQFFGNDKRLMLDNIGAMTVQNIEVYKGHTETEKWMGDANPPTHLTMDVKLKKEYSTGLMVNAQGGGGTDDRYLGRLFAAWFSPTVTVGVVANANNLNDNGRPGADNSWTPEKMPQGTRERQSAGLNISYESLDRSTNYHGDVIMNRMSFRSVTSTDRTNFFTSGRNTYDYAFDGGKNTDFTLTSSHGFGWKNKRWLLVANMEGKYDKRDNDASGISAAFDTEQADITAKVLEAIYSDGSPERLDAVINRSISRSMQRGTTWDFSVSPNAMYRIPFTSDVLRFNGRFSYSDERTRNWNDYNINYGADPVPAVVQRKYINDSPNRTLSADGKFSFTHLIGKLNIDLSYKYEFELRDRNSSSFALDRLADMGAFGVLPSDYMSAFDPDNSFRSRSYRNVHSIIPTLNWSTESRNYRLMTTLGATLSLDHEKLDYFQAGKDYPMSHTWHPVPLGEYNAGVGFSFNRGRQWFRNIIAYEFTMKPTTPDLLHMVDVVNDNDPLNINLGNPDLKTAYAQTHTLKWSYSLDEAMLYNKLKLDMSFRHNDLTRGSTYDSSTGVRRTRTYNVDGNRSFGASDNLSWQFGSIKQFTLAVGGSAQFMRLADMVGYDVEVPEKSIVNTRLLSGDMGLTWQLGRQSLQFKGSYTGRVTSSTRDGFRDIDATHFNYGVIGNFVLPAGFGISTDFTCYTRRGYGSSQLDTTDPVWNARITYSPTKRWVIMFDSFDILHRLSNVNYAMTALGRTITVTNTLPRYMLLSVQYRFSLQPKRGSAKPRLSNAQEF